MIANCIPPIIDDFRILHIQRSVSQEQKQLRIQGGAKGPWPPLPLLKLVIKKMAAISGPLYFMFLGPPSDHAGSDAAKLQDFFIPSICSQLSCNIEF